MKRKGRKDSVQSNSAGENATSNHRLTLNSAVADRYSNNSSTPEILRYIAAAGNGKKASTLRLVRCVSEPNNNEPKTEISFNEPNEYHSSNTTVADVSTNGIEQNSISDVDASLENPDFESNSISGRDSTLENPEFETVLESDEGALIELETIEEEEAISRFQQLKLLLTSRYLANEPEVWTFIAGWIIKYLCSAAFHEYMGFIPAAALGISLGSLFAYSVHGTITETINFVRNPPREITSQISEVSDDIEHQAIGFNSSAP